MLNQHRYRVHQQLQSKYLWNFFSPRPVDAVIVTNYSTWYWRTYPFIYTLVFEYQHPHYSRLLGASQRRTEPSGGKKTNQTQFRWKEPKWLKTKREKAGMWSAMLLRLAKKETVTTLDHNTNWLKTCSAVRLLILTDSCACGWQRYRQMTRYAENTLTSLKHALTSWCQPKN